MKTKTREILIYSTLSVVGLFFFFRGLVLAKAFLAPIAVAILLVMVVLPVARWLEKKGIKRAWASLISDLLILLFFVLVGWVVSAQVRSLASDWPQLQQQIETKVSEMNRYIEEKTGISITEKKTSTQTAQSNATSQEDSRKEAGSDQKNDAEKSKSFSLGSQLSGSSLMSSSGSVAMSFLNFFGTFLLVFIYIFFFLTYRSKFKKSVIKMVPEENKQKARKIISESVKISQYYLVGRLILIAILAVLYSIGLSVSGVNHAILISILAAVLTLIPYIGNIIGYFLAVGLAFASGAGLMGAVGVTITFAITQFVESYVLEPYIVGDKVNLNPVFTILAVVIGGAVWGVVGMLIAIPALGIFKVVFDNISVLKPLGYLFGKEDIKDD